VPPLDDDAFELLPLPLPPPQAEREAISIAIYASADSDFMMPPTYMPPLDPGRWTSMVQRCCRHQVSGTGILAVPESKGLPATPLIMDDSDAVCPILSGEAAAWRRDDSSVLAGATELVPAKSGLRIYQFNKCSGRAAFTVRDCVGKGTHRESPVGDQYYLVAIQRDGADVVGGLSE